MASETGKTPVQVVDYGLQLSRRVQDAHNEMSADPNASEDSPVLIDVVPDPKERSLYKKILRELSMKAREGTTLAELKRRAQLGGTARLTKMSKEERANVASAASKERWRKFFEEHPEKVGMSKRKRKPKPE